MRILNENQNDKTLVITNNQNCESWALLVEQNEIDDYNPAILAKVVAIVRKLAPKEAIVYFSETKNSEFKSNLTSFEIAKKIQAVEVLSDCDLSSFSVQCESFFYTGKIVKFENHYAIQRQSGQLEKITNFILDLRFRFKRENTLIRYLDIFRGGEKHTMELTTDAMVSKNLFQKLLYDYGDFDFLGSDSDLKELFSYLFVTSKNLSVEVIENFGYDEKTHAWILSDSFFANNQQVFFEDDDTFTIGKKTYLILASAKKDEDNFKITAPTISECEKKIKLQDVLLHMSNCVGANYAQTLVAWSLGCFFMPKILEELEMFPFLFLHGRFGSGKSVIANWCANFCGMSFGGKGLSMTTTLASLIRSTSQLSMLPIWIDEFRNNLPGSVEKESLLRSIYDRASTLRATRSMHGLVAYKARSAIILSGEELPNDAALASRCITVAIHAENRSEKNLESYLWLEQNKKYFNQFGFQILKNYRYANEIFLGNLHRESEDKKLSARTRLQYALLRALIQTIADFFEIENLKPFKNFISEEAAAIDRQRVEASAMNVFLEDVVNLINSDNMPAKISYSWFALKNGKRVPNLRVGVKKPVLIDLTLIYSIFERYKKKDRANLPMAQSALKNWLQRSPGYIDMTRVNIGNGRLTYLIFDLDKIDPDFENFFAALHAHEYKNGSQESKLLLRQFYEEIENEQNAEESNS